MSCPKCQGGSYLADEDLVKVVETTTPMKVLIKQTFVCRSCADRFSRIVSDDMEARKKDLESMASGVQTVPLGNTTTPDQAASGIQFLDNV
ncbi:MAG: hypothetical protein JSV63_03870 [Candidatus Aenigmatarchaeota archaeon]|nr:MAG: hypothetical protein JSV63_03870 [Candidatus Aenigmarchaeota archaeon]